jgi:hypothetical protein
MVIRLPIKSSALAKALSEPAPLAGLLLGWVLLLAVAAAPADAGPGWTEKGLQYLHGEGVARDADRALVYLCAAASRRDPVAAYELGMLYLQGRSVERDDGLAVAWLTQAERLGEPLPAKLMGSLSSVPPKPLACIDRSGRNLGLSNPRRADLAVAIYEMAPRFELDPALVLEVVRAESNFDPRARSHKGALGLMQLIPATARRFGVDDPFEPAQNLRGGMAYLRWLLERFDGDLRLALAGYNAGEEAVERHGGVPPYAETQDYVGRILERYGSAATDNSLI